MRIHKHDYVHTAIDEADLVITVGYDVVEYPPSVWNGDKAKTILYIDFLPADSDEYYSPAYEVVGDISNTLEALRQRLNGVDFSDPRMTRLHDTFGNPDFVDYARAYGATGLRHSEDNVLSKCWSAPSNWAASYS